MLGDALSPKIDLFYSNLIETSHDRINISMNTSIGVAARIYYQIIRAINGNESNLVEVACGSYDINAAPTAGGSMSIELPSTSYANGIVSVTDKYYIRIFEPTDQFDLALPQSVINNILASTTVSMTSLDSSTLSNIEFNKPFFKYIVNKSNIQFLNNSDFKEFAIFSLEGKKINSNKSSQLLNNIDISSLKQGVYVLILNNNKTQKVIKFIKK